MSRKTLETISINKKTRLNCDWTKKRPKNEKPITLFNCNLSDRLLWKEFEGFEAVSVSNPINVNAFNFDIDIGSGALAIDIPPNTVCEISKLDRNRYPEFRCFDK